MLPIHQQKIVNDISSGSSDLTSRAGAGWGYSWLGNIAKKQHSGKGDFFLPPESGDDPAIDFNFVGASRLQPPENIDSNDMVQITTSADEAKDFSTEDRITDYFYSIEKSMYRTISEEMLNFFGSIVDFNNLIGEPVNRYRPQYKDLEKLKQLFFDRVGNTPQLDKYVDYYKWIDSSIGEFIQQLVPASANISEDVRTMVESHVLERNKYWSKFPTIEFKAEDPEARLFGISEMLYDWEHGHAPVSAGAEKDKALWWKQRAERDQNTLRSGNSVLDRDKNLIRDRITTHISSSGIGSVTEKGGTAYRTKKYPRRVFTKVYNFNTYKARVYGGGINFNKNKKLGFIRSRVLKNAIGAPTLAVSASQVYNLPSIDDVQDPSAKNMYTFKAFTDANQNNDFTNSGKGHLIAPFNIVSSSVSTGYQSDVVLWSPPLSGSASAQITYAGSIC